MKHVVRTIAVFVWVAMVLNGCATSGKKHDDGRLHVVATTGLIADAVRNIAGDKVEVVALMGPGVDPHLYKASHGDLERITSADLVFFNGLHLEGKMGKVFEKASRIKPVVAVTKEIPPSLLRAVPGSDGSHDPHIWFDIQLWKRSVDAIAKSLQVADTANADVYASNSARYLKQLDSLDAAVRSSMLEIPASQRVLITAHDAFGYFGDAYGIQVRGLQGISTLSEFGLRDVTELVDFIISRKVKAIFVETSVSSRSIEAITEGCRERGWNVIIGGHLYSDALGNEGTAEGTYIGMINANVKTIVHSLK